MLNEIDSLSEPANTGKEELHSLDQVKKLVTHFNVDLLKKLEKYIGKLIDQKEGLTDAYIRTVLEYFKEYCSRSHFHLKRYHLDRSSKEHLHRVMKIAFHDRIYNNVFELLGLIQLLREFKHFRIKMLWDEEYVRMYKIGVDVPHYFSQNMPSTLEYETWKNLTNMSKDRFAQRYNAEKEAHHKCATYIHTFAILTGWHEQDLIKQLVSKNYQFFQSHLSKHFT